MDEVVIEGININAWVGVYEWERQQPQILTMDICYGLANANSFASDNLADTIDYGEVVSIVTTHLRDTRFNLLEALVESVAETVLTRFQAPWISVYAKKAHHVPGVHMLGVRITRQRSASHESVTEPRL